MSSNAETTTDVFGRRGPEVPHRELTESATPSVAPGRVARHVPEPPKAAEGREAAVVGVFCDVGSRAPGGVVWGWSRGEAGRVVDPSEVRVKLAASHGRGHAAVVWSAKEAGGAPG